MGFPSIEAPCLWQDLLEETEGAVGEGGPLEA